MDIPDGEIAAMADPVLRNLRITQRYYELATSLRDAGCGDDATWCAFAVWASKTAGATIRGEILPARAKTLLHDSDASHAALGRFNDALAERALRRLTHDHLGRLIEEVTAEVSLSIAAGNVLVFGELAPVYAGLLAAQRTRPADADALDAALAPALVPLGTGDDAASVSLAFRSYARAFVAPSERSTSILAANILAVAHEQRRLQPAISRALGAPVSDPLKKLIETDIVRHLPSAEARQTLDELTDDLCKVLNEAWSTALTESIMRLVTSREIFDLRKDVPALPGGMFPPALRSLTGTGADAPVLQWDRTGGTGSPSGADDWEVLEKRMNFIVNLFRSRQNDPSLFDAPFSPAQLAALAQGQLPPGPL